MSALLQLAERLVEALETAEIDYAIGGAIALGYFAPPRATQDIDINLFVEAEDAGPALEAIATLGADVSAATPERLQSQGDARVYVDGIRLDLFVNSIPLHTSAAQRRQRVNLGQRQTWVLSAEDLAVLKLLFDRPKDHLDVERMLAFQAEDLDRDYVRRWLIDCVGEDDARVQRWDAMSAAW